MDIDTSLVKCKECASRNLYYDQVRGERLCSDCGLLVEENIVPTPTGDFLYGLTPNNPKVLDQRAPVGNLTRNIVIQSPNDDAWENEGFGVHIMIMPSAIAHLDGVEIKRGGQRGRVRRYPFHWHMLSYNGSDNLGV